MGDRLPSVTIPQSELDKTTSDGTPFRYYWDRYLSEMPAIRALLAESGFTGRAHVVDYGCHLGGWVLALASMCDSVTGVDIDAPYVESLNVTVAANNLNARGIVASDLSTIASADGIVCVATLQVVGSGDLWHQFFDDARRILPKGGRMLLSISTPGMPLGWFLRLEGLTHLRKKPLVWCVRRQLSWARLWAEGVTTRSIAKGRHYYSIPADVVEAFVRQKGFDVVGRPKPTFGSYDRHTAWFVVNRR
jgi:SAM-dependent methyltransferase